MASRREMRIEILDFRGFIGGDSVTQPQCSGQLGGAALVRQGLVSKNFLEIQLAIGCKFLFEKLAFAFLTACVYWFLTSLKSCTSRGLFDANAERHRMFLCWSRAVRSGVNQRLYLFLVPQFLNRACLFKMVRKALSKNNQASSTDGMRSISFPGTQARSIRQAYSLKYLRERLTVIRVGLLTADPLLIQAMRQ